MALGLDSGFDLRKWAEWVVDGDMAHEIDAREIPKDWKTGYVPLRKFVPYELPRREPDEGECYHLNPALVDWAYRLTKDVKLDDTDAMRTRPEQFAEPNARRPPFVLKGDTLSSTTFWHGKLMRGWANDWRGAWWWRRLPGTGRSIGTGCRSVLLGSYFGILQTTMENHTQTFQGKTVLVTGASSGIGLATALAFGSRGAHVIAHYNHRRKEAEVVVASIREAGGSGEILQGDLAAMPGVRAMAQAIAGRPIDILVNNAGWLIKRTRVLEFTEELWDQVLTLNLSSAFFLAQAVLPGMVERKSGVIVNISSVAGRFGGGIGALAYSAAKAGLSAATKGLAREFAPHGIRINAVSPGTIDTEYHRTFSTAQMLDATRAATPMGRLGTAEEIADVILFLASDAARFIQGQVIEVNGGFLMV